MGLLDWLTDGSLGSMSGETGAPPPMTGMPQPPTPMPPVQQTGTDALPIAPPPQPNPGAMVPPVNPATTDIAGGMQGAGPPAPTPDPTPAAGPPDPPIAGPAPPPVPLPAPRPPGADALPPPVPTPTPAAPPINPTPAASTPPPAPGAPLSLASTAPGPTAAPYKLGDQTALGRALGINPQSKAFNSTLGGIGAGLTAAGNSKGKSPFQALASGAGATLEGGNKEAHATEKDMNAYLTQAIAAQKAGDSRAAQLATQQYQAAKLKLETDKAATDKATPSKNDSPQQLFLASQRNVAADPLVKGAMASYNNALKNGNGPTDPNVVAAKAAYDQTVQQQTAVHLAGVGLHPQTAAEIAKQPGMTQANPVTTGLTRDNIGSKLQPGQYYTNPADGKVYQYKGVSNSGSKSSSATSSKKDDDDADTRKTADATPAKKADDEDDD